MEITTGTIALLFDYIELITGTRARLFDYMGSLVFSRVMVLSLWVYHMVHQHAIACMRHDRIVPESMVSSCYYVATYMQAYGGSVFPLRDKEEWAAVDAQPILPPLYEKSADRRIGRASCRERVCQYV